MTHQRRRIVGHTSGKAATATTSFPGDDPPDELHAHSQHCTRNRGNCHGHFDTTTVSFATTRCDEMAIESPSHGRVDTTRSADERASVIKLRRGQSSVPYRLPRFRVFYISTNSCFTSRAHSHKKHTIRHTEVTAILFVDSALSTLTDVSYAD